MTYLALEGLKAHHLFGLELLERDEEEAVLERITILLQEQTLPAGGWSDSQGTTQSPA